jgi:imidazolonepropionase-like amidohydrolase
MSMRALAWAGVMALLVAADGFAQERALAVVGGTVVDPAGAERPDTTIVIRAGRIEAIGRSKEVAVPPGAVVQDGRGLFVLPGLWDAHVHLSSLPRPDVDLFIASGVTGVRDMGSDLADIARLRRARAAGEPVPRIVAAGPKLIGEGETLPDERVVSSPAQAGAVVDDLANRGVDFVKVHRRLSRATFQAIADACRRRGLPFAGHVSPEVDPVTAAVAGQLSIEHGHGMIPCTPAMRAEVLGTRGANLCVKPEIAEQLLPALARARVWFTPTLVAWRGQLLASASGSSAQVAQLSGMGHVSSGLRRHWQKMVAGSDRRSAPERRLIEELPAVAEKARRAGVRLLAGTDAGDAYVVPGFGLHDELTLLVRHGLTPAEALQAATSEPSAAFDGTTPTSGLQPGQPADLVILSASPLADIGNIRRIVAVVVNGRWLGKRALAALVRPGGRPAAP